VADTGDFIHARNLDYESQGVFDRNPAVIYFHPEKAGELNYGSVTSLGIHTAGITGFNEAGITLGLHQTFVDAVSRTGTPILSVTERVVREARTLDQALQMLQSAKYRVRGPSSSRRPPSAERRWSRSRLTASSPAR